LTMQYRKSNVLIEKYFIERAQQVSCSNQKSLSRDYFWTNGSSCVRFLFLFE